MNFIAAMTAAAARTPDAPLTVASDTRPCTATLDEVVAAGRRMGTRMTAAGIGAGDIIGCMLPNWREWLVVAVAAAQAGAVMLPIVTIYGATELGFILRQSGARWLFTPDRFRNVVFDQLVRDCGDLPSLERHVSTGTAFDALEAVGPVADPVPSDPEALALLVYTSGTTADPKGVMHSARGLLAELETMQALRTIQNSVRAGRERAAELCGAIAERVARSNDPELARANRVAFVTLTVDSIHFLSGDRTPLGRRIEQRCKIKRPDR